MLKPKRIPNTGRKYTPRDHAIRRDTARGVVLRDGKLLLIERRRPGLHYFSTPGGGIEPGETPELAVVREIYEEASIRVSVERKVLRWKEGLHTHHFYLCSYISGEPKLHFKAEENNAGPDNLHIPRFADLKEAQEIAFGYWQPIKDLLLEGVINGFPDKIIDIKQVQ